MLPRQSSLLKASCQMSLKSVVFFASAAAGHAIRSRTFSCGTPSPTEEQRQLASQFAIQEQLSREAGLSTQAALSIDVWLHTISASEGGLVSESDLQTQFDVLRDTFSPYSIELRYAGSTTTVNSGWANDANGQEMDMKKSLRRGDYRTLNFYILDALTDASGYCYLPTEAPEGSDAFYIDGCSLTRDAVPGGAYGQGKIATHEAGHWFGLWHTFDGDSCTGEGDQVDDTPAQSGPSGGCPTGRDSCPDLPGVDPIHNYMDYSVE